MNANTEGTTPPNDQPPVLKKDWRFYAGLTALGLALFMPLLALAVPFLNLSAAVSTVLVGILLAGGPEVMILIAAALLGKQVIRYFKSRALRWLWDTVMAHPVSKGRYYAGLMIVLLSFVPFYLFGYFPDLLPTGNPRIYILAGSDLSCVLGVVLMGGEFWEKLRRLFVWEGKSASADRP